MTDNEIIKVLECCGKEYSCEKCALNTWLDKKRDCIGAILVNALDLINRQKTEIERLKDLITYQKQEIKEKEQKYNQVVDDMFGLIETTRNEIAESKSEAIKEFIDELKNRVVNKYEYTDIRIFNEIDNLVKEMMEVNEDEQNTKI